MVRDEEMKSSQTFVEMLKLMVKLWELGLTYPYEGWFSDKWDSYEHKKSDGRA